MIVVEILELHHDEEKGLTTTQLNELCSTCESHYSQTHIKAFLVHMRQWTLKQCYNSQAKSTPTRWDDSYSDDMIQDRVTIWYFRRSFTILAFHGGQRFKPHRRDTLAGGLNPHLPNDEDGILMPSETNFN